METIAVDTVKTFLKIIKSGRIDFYDPVENVFKIDYKGNVYELKHYKVEIYGDNGNNTSHEYDFRLKKENVCIDQDNSKIKFVFDVYKDSKIHLISIYFMDASFLINDEFKECEELFKEAASILEMFDGYKQKTAIELLKEFIKL